MTVASESSPLFRKIMSSILLASILFLSLLSMVVYYSNEILEDQLLAKQSEFELQNIRSLLAAEPDAALPDSASLSIYLDSRAVSKPIPGYLADLPDGEHHDIQHDGKAYHVLVAAFGDDRLYIQSDITEIERSENLLATILLVAWIVFIVMLFFIARILSKRLSGPVAQLADELSRINPDQRGIRIGQDFADDEVGAIARAFDSYALKMDNYVEKQVAFAAMASHELRSPLTIVRTSTDLIASRHDDPGLNTHLEKIQRATDNMANMIHALLAVTRDRPSENLRERIHPAEMIDEIVDHLQPDITAKRIHIENRIDPGVALQADPTLLTVVLTNLLRNSIKHGGNSAIEIELAGETLSIEDNGIGIPTEDLQHIFDFTWRGQHSQGYGVGLYISRLVCDHQGWGLELIPGKEGGTVARIAFPPVDPGV